jgi:hypothetical protein
MSSRVLEEMTTELRRVGGSPAAMLALVQSIADPERMRSLVDLVLTDDQAAEGIAEASLQHANGFQKIVLAGGGPQIRLHIWQPRTPDQAAVLENAHNHRWAFATAILVGCYTASTFAPIPGNSYSWQRYAPGHSKLDYSLSDLGTSDLDTLGVARFDKGSSYWIHPSVVHRVSLSEPSVLTATVLVVGEYSAPTTDVFIPKRTATPSVGQRPHLPLSMKDIRDSLSSLSDHLLLM